MARWKFTAGTVFTISIVAVELLFFTGIETLFQLFSLALIIRIHVNLRLARMSIVLETFKMPMAHSAL